MKTFFTCALLICLFSSVCAQSPDLILYNGNIFTSDSSKLYIQALAIKNGIIVSTGANKDVLRLARPGTKKINLLGKTVIPGINDAHDHPGSLIGGKGYEYSERQIPGPPPAAVLDSVSRLVKTSRPGEWIKGSIGQSILTDMNFRRKLDSIAPNNPVFLFAWWGHGVVFNSQALKLAGICDSDKDPLGGWYERDVASGKINTLKEYAGWDAIETYYSSVPDSIKIQGLKNYTDQQIRYGITTIQFMTTFAMVPAIIMQNPAIRTRIIPFITTAGTSRNLGIWNKFHNDIAPLVYMSGLKYIIDGTPFDESSLSSKPYPGHANWFGRLDYQKDTIRQVLKETLRGSRQLMMHIVGDSAFNTVLSLMKNAGSYNEWSSKRVRIEHNGAYSPNMVSQVKDIKNLHLLMMHTPMYARQSPLGSLIKNGIKVGISPDGLTNPFVNIMIVTSQQSNASENITREEAVILYTKNNAYAEFTENSKGTLTMGKVADLAVLSQNIFVIPTALLPQTRSLLTMVAGKIIYSSIK
jgi:predicted amidohydrolase YtcJ